MCFFPTSTFFHSSEMYLVVIVSSVHSIVKVVFTVYVIIVIIIIVDVIFVIVVVVCIHLLLNCWANQTTIYIWVTICCGIKVIWVFILYWYANICRTPIAIISTE